MWTIVGNAVAKNYKVKYRQVLYFISGDGGQQKEAIDGVCPTVCMESEGKELPAPLCASPGCPAWVSKLFRSGILFLILFHFPCN